MTTAQVVTCEGQLHVLTPWGGDQLFHVVQLQARADAPFAVEVMPPGMEHEKLRHALTINAGIALLSHFEID
jgi:hypothetical protein